MDDRRAKAVLSALRSLRSAAAADARSFETTPFNGWVDKLGEALDEDLSHLTADEPELASNELIPSIDMVIAFAEALIGNPEALAVENNS